MRRALELWPEDDRIAWRVAAFPGAPTEILREIARKWCAGPGVGGGGWAPRITAANMGIVLVNRDDALSDPEIRRVLLDEPATHHSLVFEASDEEFPALFASLARTPTGVMDALCALDVRLGRGNPHGLAPEDLAAIGAARPRLPVGATRPRRRSHRPGLAQVQA